MMFVGGGTFELEDNIMKVTAEAILRVQNFTAHQPENASVWITEKEIEDLQTIEQPWSVASANVYVMFL